MPAEAVRRALARHDEQQRGCVPGAGGAESGEARAGDPAERVRDETRVGGGDQVGEFGGWAAGGGPGEIFGCGGCGVRRGWSGLLANSLDFSHDTVSTFSSFFRLFFSLVSRFAWRWGSCQHGA